MTEGSFNDSIRRPAPLESVLPFSRLTLPHFHKVHFRNASLFQPLRLGNCGVKRGDAMAWNIGVWARPGVERICRRTDLGLDIASATVVRLFVNRTAVEAQNPSLDTSLWHKMDDVLALVAFLHAFPYESLLQLAEPPVHIACIRI